MVAAFLVDNSATAEDLSELRALVDVDYLCTTHVHGLRDKC
jgi:hypothetical protein